MKINLSKKERAIMNHALYRLINLLGEEAGFAEEKKSQLMTSLIFQLAYDHTNPWVANQIIHNTDGAVLAIWDEAYASAEMVHAAEKVEE